MGPHKPQIRKSYSKLYAKFAEGPQLKTLRQQILRFEELIYGPPTFNINEGDIRAT
jgi:hypothetical protein